MPSSHRSTSQGDRRNRALRRGGQGEARHHHWARAGRSKDLIKRLKDNQLIVIESGRMRLSAKGEKEYEKHLVLLRLVGTREGEVPRARRELLGGPLRGSGEISSVRDRAEGCRDKGWGRRGFHFRIQSGRFTIPGEGTDCEKDGPGEPWITVRKAGPHEGDVVVVTGSSSESDSEDGALAAVPHPHLKTAA